MLNLESNEILMAGVRHLEAWLGDNGYKSIQTDVWQEGSADVLADGPGENILIQVKTIMLPGQPELLNATDKFALKELAVRMTRVPYIAYLEIDHDKHLVGEIDWHRI